MYDLRISKYAQYDDKHALAGYRRAPIKKYLLFYKADENNKVVDVLRVLYTSSDYESKLID